MAPPGASSSTAMRCRSLRQPLAPRAPSSGWARSAGRSARRECGSVLTLSTHSRAQSDTVTPSSGARQLPVRPLPTLRSPGHARHLRRSRAPSDDQPPHHFGRHGGGADAVVYNHTAEGNHPGPTLSMRSIDRVAHYRLVEDDLRYSMDYTGTGNSLSGDPRYHRPRRRQDHHHHSNR
jgi:hypothetical protein